MHYSELFFYKGVRVDHVCYHCISDNTIKFRNQRKPRHIGMGHQPLLRNLPSPKFRVPQKRTFGTLCPDCPWAHTCSSSMSSWFSDPGVFSINMAVMTFTFIFTISNSLCSFPICGNPGNPQSLSVTHRQLAILLPSHRTNARDQMPLQNVTFSNTQRSTSAYV